MFTLAMTADLEGVTDLAPVDNENSPYFFTFRVQCTSCRETHPNWEQNEISGSRGEANFVWKCKQCKREATASMKAGPKPYKQESPPTKQNIIEFDTRGLEFTEFKADGTWTAKGTDSGTSFSEVNLEEGEWYEFDEKSGEQVSVTEVTWEIKRA